MASQPGQLFVGRHREMETLNAALEDALAGRGRVVMLVGEPGIGKTRTAQELAGRARDQGAQILWGWCYDQQGAPAYWPWLQAIRSYVQQRDPDMLRTEMGPGAADIAEIVPDVSQKLEGLTPPPQLEPEQARFRLFDSITTFLTTAAQNQPLVLVLDDLHWADKPSLLLLEFLVRQMSDSRILVIGCYRDTELTRHHPLPETLAQLSREPVFKRESLRGLSQEDSDRLIGASIETSTDASLDASLPQELLDTVYDHTEGNPFFTSEVIRLLSDAGDLDPERAGTAHAITIPDGVREVIGQRLNRLSEHCHQALTMASVIGREFDFNLLQRLDQTISEEQWLEGIDEGVAARLIEEVPEEIDRYRFSHALIQQSLSEELTTSRRVRLHGRVGQALEELYGGDPDMSGHAAELAYHFAEAESVLGPEKLAHYSLLAGERALATYAWEDAQAHFEQGLVARGISLSGTEAAADEEAAALLFGLARTQAATFERHRLGEVFGTLNRAFEYYAEAGNVALAVATAEFPVAPAGVLIPGVAQLMARALTLVPADSHEAGRLLSRYGGILGAAEGDYEGAQKALSRALAIARREGDVPLEVQTLTNACDVSGRHLHWQESVDNGVQAIELLTGDENPYYEVLSRYFTALGLLHMGDPGSCRPHALALRDRAERRVTGVLASLSFGPIIYLSCLQGDWKSAREHSDRSLEVAPLDPLLLLPRVLLEHETGESAQGEVYLERLLEAMHRSVPSQVRASGRVSLAITTLARITGVPDRLEIAEEAAEWILSNQSVTPQDAMHAKAGLALLAVQEGDQSAAKMHHALLLGKRGTMTSSVTSIDRILGLLSQTMGNLDQSAAHFEDAIAFCRKAGYKPELAWTCCDYADTLLERNAEGDHTKVLGLLDESLAISSILGMGPLAERVAVRQKLAKAQPSRAPVFPDGLTQREVEVLRLIATGKTDREIAEELIISVNTVGNHVRSILNKTGVANRTEAASYATRRGLAGDGDSDGG